MYEIGDVLRIRQWDDMADEFRIHNGAIRFSHSIYFSNAMKDLCGKEFTVKEIYDSPGLIRCYRSEEGCEGGWYIASEMLEPVSGQLDDITITNDEFIEILKI